jgi:hypothetical protein
LHALDRAWDECAEKLSAESTGPEDSTWTGWNPGSMPNDSIENMLAAIVQELGTNGHLEDRVHLVEVAIASLPNPPFPAHDAETAWAHVYLALLYAQTPATGGQPADRMVDWIICELTMD